MGVAEKRLVLGKQSRRARSNNQRPKQDRSLQHIVPPSDRPGSLHTALYVGVPHLISLTARMAHGLAEAAHVLIERWKEGILKH